MRMPLAAALREPISRTPRQSLAMPGPKADLFSEERFATVRRTVVERFFNWPMMASLPFPGGLAGEERLGGVLDGLDVVVDNFGES